MSAKVAALASGLQPGYRLMRSRCKNFNSMEELEKVMSVGVQTNIPWRILQHPGAFCTVLHVQNVPWIPAGLEAGINGTDSGSGSTDVVPPLVQRFTHTHAKNFTFNNIHGSNQGCGTFRIIWLMLTADYNYDSWLREPKSGSVLTGGHAVNTNVHKSHKKPVWSLSYNGKNIVLFVST